MLFAIARWISRFQLSTYGVRRLGSTPKISQGPGGSVKPGGWVMPSPQAGFATLEYSAGLVALIGWVGLNFFQAVPTALRALLPGAKTRDWSWMLPARGSGVVLPA